MGNGMQGAGAKALFSLGRRLISAHHVDDGQICGKDDEEGNPRWILTFAEVTWF
jgi:hypothetical protein